MKGRLQSIYEQHCIYLPSMLGWFVFSALLSTYNKEVFGSSHMAFPCPLLLTSLHFLIQWVFSWTISSLFPAYLGGDRVQSMGLKEFLDVSVPCGLVTSGDIGLSNLALVRISMSFYTMVKASTPIFVLLWAYIFSLERITISLILVVCVIAIGEFLTVMGEADRDTAGFFMCLGASFLSGARWTLVQLKLSKLSPPLKTTIATMRVLSPSMFATMLLVSFAIERPWISLADGYFDNLNEILNTLGLGLLGGFIAIAMIMCEFHLIMHASAIILMIGGVVKEMITIIIGVSVYDDVLNLINIAGCATVFIGVVLYKVQFHLSKKQHDTMERGDEHGGKEHKEEAFLMGATTEVESATTFIAEHGEIYSNPESASSASSVEMSGVLQ